MAQNYNCEGRVAKGVPASVQRLRSYGPSTSSATGTHNDLPQGSPPDCTQFISSIAPAGKESALYLVEDDVRSARYPSRSTEFEEKYPPDRYGEEAAPNARVWRVYRDRVTDLDEDLVKGWNATLDVLLIFAGLFSAVATAFIIEASKQLQHDYLQYTAIGVFAVLAELNTTVTAPQSLPDLNKVKSTTRAGWVNGLWFTSLILALIDALLAILVKQWLVEYESRMRQPAADARRWAWRHFAFREGLGKWRIGGFISSLSALLHMALFLFLFGLVAFLFDLHPIIWAVGVILTVLTGLFYVVATLAPLRFGDCPSFTPLLTNLRALALWIKRIVAVTSSEPWDSEILPAYHSDSVTSAHEAHCDAKVLFWMVRNLLKESDVIISLDAIGSQDIVNHRAVFSPAFQRRRLSSELHAMQAIERRLHSLLRSGSNPALNPAELALALRAWLVLHWSIDADTRNMITGLPAIQSYTIPTLSSVMKCRWYLGTDGLGMLLDTLHDWNEEWLTREREPLQVAQILTLNLLLSDIAARVSSQPEPRLLRIAIVHINSLVGPLCRDSYEESTMRLISDLGARVVDGLVHHCASDNSRRLWTCPETHTSYSWCTSLLVTWSYALEFAATLSIDANATSLAEGYRTILLHTSTQISPTTPLKARHIESMLSCLPSQIKLWPAEFLKHNELAAAASSLLAMAMGDRDHWSAKLGEIAFEILLLLQSFTDSRIAAHRETDDIVWRMSVMWTCHDDLVDNLSRYDMIDDYVQETKVNLILPRPLPHKSLETSSTWWAATQVSQLYQLSDAAQGFAAELAMLSRLLDLGILKISDRSKLGILLDELAGGDRAIQLAISDGPFFVNLAIHGKEVSEDWWGDMKRRLLALSAQEWNGRGSRRLHAAPQDLVNAIENSGPCADCRRILPQIIARRKIVYRPEFTVASNPALYQTAPGSSAPPAATIHPSKWRTVNLLHSLVSS